MREDLVLDTLLIDEIKKVEKKVTLLKEDKAKKF